MLTSEPNSLNNTLGGEKKDKKNKGKILINNIIEDKIRIKENIFVDEDDNCISNDIYNNKHNYNKYNYNHELLDLDELDCCKLESKKNIVDNKYIDNKYIDDDYIELEKLEKEFTIKSGYNSSSHPKNYGNIWNDEERNKIKKYLLKNKFNKDYGMFDESNIFDIAKKLERSEYGVKEEIKKMIYNEYTKGYSYDKISENFNIPTNNIKLIIKVYIEKYGKKLINQLEFENKLLRLKVENIKLKKELEELNK